MRFKHRFVVRASQSRVLEFHLRPAALATLTPPPAILQVHRAPDPLQEGDTFAFTLWLGPIPVYWESVFPEVAENGFVDIQGEGLFCSWEHRHTFIPIDEHTTEVTDVIEASLQRHPWKAIVAIMMWASLPLLFAYRTWQTRRHLER